MNNMATDRFDMFGMPFCAIKPEVAAKAVVDAAILSNSPFLVITPNVDHIVSVHKDASLRSIYKSAEFLFADGMPLVWLSRLLPGAGLPARVTGADLLYSICREAAFRGASIAFLGGKEGVAAKAADKAVSMYPGLLVKGVYSPPFGFENNSLELKKIIDICAKWNADIICVGLGAPKQEQWAHASRGSLQRGAILCFGAAIDFMAGEVVRAPLWMQRYGCEWLWRLVMEPGRMWRRYLIRDPVYILLAIKELFTRWRASLNASVHHER